MLRIWLLLLLTLPALFSEDDYTLNVPATEPIPSWILIGILTVETKSHYGDDGHIVYVDKQRGADGEIGPFQMTKAAFNQVKVKGDSFWRMEKDREYAEWMARRYLSYLYENQAKQSWILAIGMYNTGPDDGKSARARAYIRQVERASLK